MKYKKLKLKLIDFLEKNNIDYEETSSGHEVKIVECPSCGKIKKLYVNPDNGVAQCKYANCDLAEGISPVRLVKELLNCSFKEAIKICYGQNEPEQLSEVSLENEWNFDEFDQSIKKEEKTLKEISMLRGAVPLTKDHSSAWNYLISRGFNEEIIKKTNPYIIPFYNYKDADVELKKINITDINEMKLHKRFMNRIIFPLYVKNILYGYIARDFTNTQELKVLNSEGNFRSLSIWNFDNVQGTDTLVIAEGITDAIKCGVNRSIAILGTACTDEQIKLIKEINPQKIVFALDVGTDQVKNKLYEKLFISFPNNIYEVQFENLFYHKKELLNQEIIDKINTIVKQQIMTWGKSFMYIEYKDKEEIKKRLKENSIVIDYENLSNLKLFFKEASYKDAGDFSEEEMDQKIKNCTLFQKIKEKDNEPLF